MCLLIVDVLILYEEADTVRNEGIYSDSGSQED